MNVSISDYLIKNNKINVVNVNDTNLENFDITWAVYDRTNAPGWEEMVGGAIKPQDWQHKIGDRLWDKIPGESYECDHSVCDGSITYQYNNEYFRCDDFTSEHDGMHILFAGCSETEGVGGPLESTWTHRVYKEIAKNNKVSGFYSIARAGFGWQKIITNFQIYTKKYGFPQFLFVMLPNVGRQYKYDVKEGLYTYYQCYPEDYYIDENQLCTTSNGKKISSNEIYKEGIILLEDYFKAILDFKISWTLFENFCKSNGTTVLWSTYDSADTHNLQKLDVNSSYFVSNTDEVNSFITTKIDYKIEKDSFRYRDGHYGSLIKEYWSELFLKEIKERDLLKI